MMIARAIQHVRPTRHRLCAIATACLGILPIQLQAMEAQADVVLRHGAVYTLDAQRSWGQAVAIRMGRVLYVGSDAGAEKLVGPRTEVIELGGKTVLPSFRDSHVHPISTWNLLSRCDLTGLSTTAAILQKVRTCRVLEGGGPWLIGRGWDSYVLQNAQLRQNPLDNFSDISMYLESSDGHCAWVNSRALMAARITASTPNPKGGSIDRFQDGRLSGVLRESAIKLVELVVPQPTTAEYAATLEGSVKLMNSLGITAFQDANVTEAKLRAYLRVEHDDKLTARVVAAMWVDPAKGFKISEYERLRHQYSRGLLRASALKLFLDGIFESRTAALLQPYVGTWATWILAVP